MMLIQSCALVGHKEPMIQMRGVKYTTEEPLNFEAAERIDIPIGTDNYRLLMKIVSMDRGISISSADHSAFLADEECWALMKIAAGIKLTDKRDMRRLMESGRDKMGELLNAHLLL